MVAMTVGIDLAKSVFQVHGVDSSGEIDSAPPAGAQPPVGLFRAAVALPDRHRGLRERASLGARARAPRA